MPDFGYIEDMHGFWSIWYFFVIRCSWKVRSTKLVELVSNKNLSSISCMKCRSVGGKYMHFMTANTHRLRNSTAYCRLHPPLINPTFRWATAPLDLPAATPKYPWLSPWRRNDHHSAGGQRAAASPGLRAPAEPLWLLGLAGQAGPQAENGPCTILHLIKFQIHFLIKSQEIWLN
jgi:hypothetical protein